MLKLILHLNSQQRYDSFQFTIRFDILMSSLVTNEPFNGCTFEVYIKVRYKISRQTLRYHVTMKYAEIRGNKNSAGITRTIK